MRRRYIDDLFETKDGNHLVLPTQSTRSLKRRKASKCSKRWICRSPIPCLLVACGVLALLIHEIFYYWCLNRLDLGFPASPSRVPSKSLSVTHTSVAVVSLHRGIKFAGYLGGWLSEQKHKYARFQGYSYFDERAFPSDESQLVPLSPWQQEYKRRIKFDKLRYILYLMETYPNLEYLFWLDADAIVTQATISIHDRIQQFQSRKQGDFCFAWSEDGKPNTGVILLTNTPVTRQLVRTSLSTFSETQVFMDQASFTNTVKANATYSSCQVLLTGDESRLMQSRVRGRKSLLWKPGDWVLHLPNHNRLEILNSLYKWLPKYSEQDEQPCNTMAPVQFPDISTLSPERRHRFEAVQEAIRHAWKGYRTHVITETGRGAIPHDDLAPLSETGHSWLHYAATLHDSIDTLYLANLKDEYNQAVSMLTSFDIQTTSLRVTKTFEYSLRILGGLLGAYSLSGDPKLFTAARNAADALLDGPFRSSPTPLPRSFNMLAPSTSCASWDWKASLYRTCARLYEWGRDAFTNEHNTNSLAGVGSFALEFSFLSSITRDPSYRRASDAIFDHVQKEQNSGAIPTAWNVMTGQPADRRSLNLGSAADSFYEYLLKVPFLNDCSLGVDGSSKLSCSESDKAMLSLYRNMVKEALRPKHVNEQILDGGAFHNETVYFPVDNGMVFHHLLCFLPGLLALGANGKHEDMALAKDLLSGCYAAYRLAPSGLAPESLTLKNDAEKRQRFATQQKEPAAHSNTSINIFLKARAPSYFLRPEFVESLFVMYRLTGDKSLQDIAWDFFRNLERHCRVDGGGYAGLKNVYDPSKDRLDDMPSYFIAETLKYLLLIFGPDDFISLNDFVFTTEAHPIRKVHVDTSDLPFCVLKTNPPVPVPWSLLTLVVCSAISLCVMVHTVALPFFKWCRNGDKSKNS
jgi:mannosyl-oligosaccharide alpha-1,2-mannosidase